MKRSILASCLLLATLEVQGFDFGKVGTSFEIKEEGFVSMMMKKLQEVDLEKEQERVEKIARQKVEEPDPVKDIKPATKYREFWHDPTFILKNDVLLPCGSILYKAGTAVNPLDHIDLERRLFFIDGRIDAQIDWLKKYLEENKEEKVKDKIILIAGNVFKMQKELGRKVYFDQAGEITSKWGIKATPAIARQDGKMIKIIEVYLE